MVQPFFLPPFAVHSQLSMTHTGVKRRCWWDMRVALHPHWNRSVTLHCNCEIGEAQTRSPTVLAMTQQNNNAMQWHNRTTMGTQRLPAYCHLLQLVNWSPVIRLDQLSIVYRVHFDQAVIVSSACWPYCHHIECVLIMLSSCRVRQTTNRPEFDDSVIILGALWPCCHHIVCALTILSSYRVRHTTTRPGLSHHIGCALTILSSYGMRVDHAVIHQLPSDDLWQSQQLE